MKNLSRNIAKAVTIAGFISTTAFAINPVDWTSAPEKDDQIVMKIGHISEYGVELAYSDIKALCRAGFNLFK